MAEPGTRWSIPSAALCRGRGSILLPGAASSPLSLLPIFKGPEKGFYSEPAPDVSSSEQFMSPQKPLPGNLMLEASFPALGRRRNLSLSPAARPSLAPPPPLGAEDKRPTLFCFVPKSWAPSHPKHLPLESPAPACSRAEDKHTSVPAPNKCLASQDISGSCHKSPAQAVLQEFMELEAFFHLTVLLREGLHPENSKAKLERGVLVPQQRCPHRPEELKGDRAW